MNLDTIVCADALEYLKSLPDNYVNCVVTSPPYFGLRDYGVSGQIGLEATPQAFVARMVDVFREVKRVLRDDGTCFVNFGDSYASGNSPQVMQSNKNGVVPNPQRPHSGDIQPKNLLGIPWRVAFALQDDGWILRSDIIWHKPNPMPESVTDRPTKAHEYVFLMTKQPRYWYDADAIRETAIYDGKIVTLGEKSLSKGQAVGANVSPSGNGNATSVTVLPYRNRRSVWTVATEPTPFAHFATFPQKLIEPMILAGCPDKVCSACGKPWVRVVEASGGTLGKSWHPHGDDLGKGMSQYSGLSGGVGNAKDSNGKRYTRETVDWQPTCTCHADTRPGIVLDPFMGSGTVALVSARLGRHYIGCDLNSEYVELARKRIAQSDPYQDRELKPGITQLSMFSMEAK